MPGDPAADGQALFKLLLADDELLKAWGEARGRSKQRRVRLRIDPSALHALPWELLRDGCELIAADADTPFSRYLAIDKAVGPSLADRPIRILAVISNPSDLKDKYALPPADVASEENTLRQAFSWVGGEGVSLALGFFYSNGGYGRSWGVRQLAEIIADAETGETVVHYKGIAGTCRRKKGHCSPAEFARWARHQVALVENDWKRVGGDAPSAAEPQAV